MVNNKMNIMKRSKWPALVLFSAVLSGCQAPAEDPARILVLEGQIAALEARLSTLEEANTATPAPEIDGGAPRLEVLDPSRIRDLASPGAEVISLHEAIRVPDVMEFTLQSVQWQDRIEPGNTSSLYTYKDDQLNETYLVLRGQLKNLSAGDLYPGDHQESILRINDTQDFYVYWDLEQPDGTGFYGTLKPGATGELVIYSSVRDDVKDGMVSGRLTMKLPAEAGLKRDFLYTEGGSPRILELLITP